MANTTTNYYAEGRDQTLLPETVHIFSRTAIHSADSNTNEGKINAISGTVEILAKHSNHVSRDTQAFRDEIQESMLSNPGPQGEEETNKCPFMRVAFSNAIRADYEELTVDGEDGRTTLFDQGWDGELVFTETKVVSKSLIDNKLIAGYVAPGSTKLPTVIPLESSLARKEGNIEDNKEE